MKKRRSFWLLWIFITAALYFFENNSGTRIVFGASVLVPLFSAFCAVWCADKVHFSIDLPNSIRQNRPFPCRISVSGSVLLNFCVPSAAVLFEDSFSGKTSESGPILIDGQKVVHPVSETAGFLSVSLSHPAVEDVFGLFRFPLAGNAEMPHVSAPVLPSSDNVPETLSGRSDPSAYSGIREYVPGDPVRMIHWKLTEKTDRVLIRENDHEPEETIADNHPERLPGEKDPQEEVDEFRISLLPEEVSRNNKNIRTICSVCGGLILSAAGLLLFVPAFQNSGKALLNRLFSASEAVNAYAYRYFDVRPDQTMLPASLLLVLILLSFLVTAVASKKPLIVLAGAGILALVQSYFGLSLPPLVNVVLFVLPGVLFFRGKLSLRRVLFFLLPVGLAAGLVLTQYPGKDPWIESRSETIRDQLTVRSVPFSDSSAGSSDEPTETRHVNSRSLITGEGEAGTQKEFRLITEDEAQISLPEWAGSLNLILPVLLGLAAAGIVFPPLLRMLMKRKKAASERSLFDSQNSAEAVRAMFLHSISWLESFGFSGGNLPFQEWAPVLARSLPDEYIREFKACVPVYEEALYSDHDPAPAGREKVKTLMEDTKKRLLAEADWKKTLRLKFVECLMP